MTVAPAPPRPAEAGFALVETMAAMAIVAIMTGVTFQAIDSSALTARLMNERRAAILVAQSAIANSDADPVGHADGHSGQSGNLVWRLNVSPYDEDTRSTGPQLQRITAEVSDAVTSRKIVTLETLRLSR